jgi:hypothetical protein
MSDQFKDYVTGGAFHLSLSRRQTEMLSCMDQFGWTWGHLSTASALIDKGLCERVEDGEFSSFRLTEAGRLVIPLLRLAGLYTRLDIPDAVEVPPVEIVIKRKQPVDQQ